MPDYRSDDHDLLVRIWRQFGRSVPDWFAEAIRIERLRELWAEGTDPTFRGPGGATALHFAAAYGARESVRFLIERGADVNALDDSGQTPACRAVRVSPFGELSRYEELELVRPEAALETLQLLHVHGADLSVHDADGRSLIDLAGTQDVIDYLVDHLDPEVLSVAGGETERERELRFRTAGLLSDRSRAPYRPRGLGCEDFVQTFEDGLSSARVFGLRCGDDAIRQAFGRLGIVDARASLPPRTRTAFLLAIRAAGAKETWIFAYDSPSALPGGDAAIRVAEMLEPFAPLDFHMDGDACALEPGGVRGFPSVCGALEDEGLWIPAIRPTLVVGPHRRTCGIAVGLVGYRVEEIEQALFADLDTPVSE
ncbi:MAG: ankyrin repeat domain-containing protein [Myxococcales bacterium]|nr:ankyrin repeat domain-containing protein [Myxococcales bacterium]